MVKMVEARQQVMYFNGRMMPHSQAVTELQGRDVVGRRTL